MKGMELSREEKAMQNCHLMNKWLYLKNEGIPIKKYLEENGIKTVAVYGLGDLGKRLIEELQNYGITIKYLIDARASVLFSDLDIYTLDDDLPDADVVIVTVLYDFSDIWNAMPERLKEKCISLKTIVNCLWERCWVK